MPEISVVMPIYNGEEYLPEAIESILDQTFADFEFIIVCEQGSNAESIGIVERYAQQDRRLRPIYNEKRLGISASLNVGLKAATGKYIARMDGDDISGRRRFEVQKLFLDAYPEIGVVGTSHTVINSPNWLVDYVTDPDLIESQLLFFVPIRHPTVMLRRTITDGCFYNEDLPGAEDFDFLYKLSQRTKMSNILDPELFSYRRTDQNASLVNSNRDIMIRKSLMKKWLFEKCGFQTDDRRLDILNILGNAAYQGVPPKKYPSILLELENLLSSIEEKNHELRAYKPHCLLQTLSNRWFREKYKLDLMLNKKIPDEVMRVWQESKYYSPWF